MPCPPRPSPLFLHTFSSPPISRPSFPHGSAFLGQGSRCRFPGHFVGTAALAASRLPGGRRRPRLWQQPLTAGGSGPYPGRLWGAGQPCSERRVRARRRRSRRSGSCGARRSRLSRSSRRLFWGACIYAFRNASVQRRAQAHAPICGSRRLQSASACRPPFPPLPLPLPWPLPPDALAAAMPSRPLCLRGCRAFAAAAPSRLPRL